MLLSSFNNCVQFGKLVFLAGPLLLVSFATTTVNRLASPVLSAIIAMSPQSAPIISSDSEQPDVSEHKRKHSDVSLPSKKSKITAEDNAQHLDHTHVQAGWLDTSSAIKNTTGAAQQELKFSYHQGNMFADAPRGTVLIHACNAQGHWGAGIAKAFKIKYPNAYAEHNKFCAKDHNQKNTVPTGTAQLLAPRDGKEQHWIGCLFTSAKYGKRKDKPNTIIENSIKSIQMLLELISQVDKEVSGLRMCKINSGKFGVPWEKTEEALQSIVLKPHWRTRIEVWEPEE